MWDAEKPQGRAVSVKRSWREFVFSLPEVTEEPHFEKSSFRVRGKIFATLPEDGDHLHLFIDEEATRALVASDPSAFEPLHWGKRLAGVRLKLALVDEELLCELLEESWRRKAPKALVAKLDEIRADSSPR